MPDDIVRVLRIVEYEGPRDLVEEQIANSIHGTRWGVVGRSLDGQAKPRVRITATTLGEFPERLEVARQTPDPAQLLLLQDRIDGLMRMVRGLRSEIADLTKEASAS